MKASVIFRRNIKQNNTDHFPLNSFHVKCLIQNFRIIIEIMIIIIIKFEKFENKCLIQNHSDKWREMV